MIKNIITFYIISLIFLFNVFGYGLLFKRLFKNVIDFKFHEVGFFGFITIYIISNLIHFFIPLTKEVSYLFLLIGLICFLKYFDFKNYFIEKYFLSSLAFFLILALTINFHDDRYWYQLPYVNYYQNYKTIIGVNSLNFFFYGNSIYDIMSIFNIQKFPNSIIYIIPCTVIFFVFFFIFHEIKNRDFDHLLILLIFFIFLILFRYSRSKEYGADLFTMSFMFLVVYYSWKENEKHNIDNLFKIFTLFIFSIFSKIYAIFLIFYPLYFLIKSSKATFILIKYKSFLILIFLLLSVSFLKNYLHSSCLIYPIKFTCVSSNNWYNGDRVIERLQTGGEASAKGFKNFIYQEKNPKLTPHEFLEKNKYTYIKYLILDKDIERIIILVLILVITYFIFFRSLKFKINKKYKLIFSLSVCSLLFWFLYLPQSRYGGNLILLTFLASFFSLMNKHISVKFDKISITFIFISLSFFTTKNIDRIYKQIVFSKENKINFPFKKFDNFSATKKKLNNFDFMVSDHERYCINSNIMCVTSSNFESINKIISKKTFILIIPDRNKLYLSLKKQAYDHRSTFINYK